MAHDNAMQAILASFNDPDHAKRYKDGPQRFVAGMAEVVPVSETGA